MSLVFGPGWKSGAGAAVNLTLRSSRGRNFESVSWLICRRGRAGPGLLELHHIGRIGSSFGGSRALQN